MTAPLTPDLAKLKALAEAATQGEWIGSAKLEICYRSNADDQTYGMLVPIGDAFDKNDLDYIAAANPTTILALLSHITRVEAERDAAWNDGVEAAAQVAFKHDYVSLGQGVAVRDAIRKLTRPTTQPEDKI